MKLPIILTAIGLVLIFEGALPFLSPQAWRRVMQKLFIQNDIVVHVIGLISMLIGLAIVVFVHYFY